MSSILSIEQLNAGYGDFEILEDIDLELEENSISVLMGPNGAGKTTLLKSVFNLTDVYDGKITFRQDQITGCSAHELLERGISFVSQGKVNFDKLTVEENLFMGGHFMDEEQLEQRKEEIYQHFPMLKEKKNEYAFSLSGGQQQMLAIGRGLMSHPELLLLDEPTLGLAPKLVQKVFEHIKKIRSEFDTTILVVEHNLKSLMEIADYGFILVDGELIAEGKCSELKDSEVMEKVFVGEFD
ncbi:MAG: ABC transporter ATP-binding protein [Candidatus Paceibacteria bacterium]